MKRIFLFSIFVFLVALPLASAQARYDVIDRSTFIDSSVDTSNGIGFIRLYQRNAIPGSSVYNQRAKGTTQGFNPYYQRSVSSSFNNPRSSHTFLRDSLSYNAFKHPNLLTPRSSSNNHRNLRGFNPNGDFINFRSNKGFFNLFHEPNRVTGQLRTNVKSIFAN